MSGGNSNKGTAGPRSDAGVRRGSYGDGAGGSALGQVGISCNGLPGGSLEYARGQIFSDGGPKTFGKC